MNLESSVSLGADANPLTQKYTRKQKQKQHMAKKLKNNKRPYSERLDVIGFKDCEHGLCARSRSCHADEY